MADRYLDQDSYDTKFGKFDWSTDKIEGEIPKFYENGYKRSPKWPFA